MSNDENSISNDNIRDITGIDNEIWIATENGLNKYDKNTNKFTSYFYEDENSVVSNNIRSLFIDKDGDLWITTEEGVCTFDRKNNFQHYNELFISPRVNKTIRNIFVKSIF